MTKRKQSHRRWISAKPPDLAGERTRHSRRSLLSILLVGVFLAGCITPVATPVAAEFTSEQDEVVFEQHEVVTGSAEHQTVLPGFFLGGATAELVVVHIDENDDRRVQMYGFDNGTWELVLEASLRPGVLFVDMATIGGRDRLITHERGRLNWFDPDSASELTLVELDFDYNPEHDLEGSATQPGAEIPRVNITRDLNHDGRDDLLVPDVGGFWVSIQMSDGSFTDAMKLGPPEPFAQHPLGKLDFGFGKPGSDDVRSYGDVGMTAVTIPIYLSRVHEIDYDHDGLSDLVFWNEDHFDVYHQNERGLFSPVAETFTLDVHFDGEGIYSRALEFAEHGFLSQLIGIGEKTQRTVLYLLRDLNGDGVADLVTLTLSGRSLLKQRSVYEVHFGRATADGTVFARDAGAVIRPRGKGGALQPWGYASQWFGDLDADGQVDMMFREIKVGIGGMTRALVGNSVPVDLEFYRSEGGLYPDRPTTKRKLRRFAPFAGLGNVFLPAVVMGDVNGDGRSDLVVGRSPEELHIFLGVPGPNLFSKKPQKIAVALPADERNTWLVDLNVDGKQDVLIHRGPTDHKPTEPHRLTTLIAR